MTAAAKAPAPAAAKEPAEAPAKAPKAPEAQAHQKPVAAAKAANKTPRDGVAAQDVQHEVSEEFLVEMGKELWESSHEYMTQGLHAVPKMLAAIAAKVGLPETHALFESGSLTDAISLMMNAAAISRMMNEEEEAQRKKVPKKTKAKALPAEKAKAPPAEKAKAPPAEKAKAPPAEKAKAPPAEKKKAQPAAAATRSVAATRATTAQVPSKKIPTRPPRKRKR